MINYSSMRKAGAQTKMNHIFSLIRLRKECYYPPISVDFTPISRPTHESQSILPTFNQDKHFYTSAFVIPYEQSRLAAVSSSFLDDQKEKFLRKIQSNKSSPEEQNIQFNPRDDHYCSMCRIGFASYWEHINSKKHLRQIKSSRANKHIHELCTSYRRANENSSPNPDLKHSQLPKKKKIAKPAKTEKAKTKESVYKKDDLIIRIPKSLLEKEQVFNCNMSTNGLNSLEPKE